MKLFYLISILILFNGCNAQTQNDSIPKEFEFINVFLPENLVKITPDSLKKSLAKGGGIVIEHPIEYDSVEIIPLTYQDSIKLIKNKLNDYYITASSSINDFNVFANYYYNTTKDTLTHIQIEIIDPFLTCLKELDNSYLNQNEVRENEFECMKIGQFKNIETDYIRLYNYIHSYLKEQYYDRIKDKLWMDSITKSKSQGNISRSVIWSAENNEGFNTGGINLNYTTKVFNTRDSITHISHSIEIDLFELALILK